ncbi:hypothetical protein GCM10018783_02340 [Streptomyces griseosporeus]|nr:hypothetical protein GCM10018783_02340 [Streptomyces griseosporeus]
MPALSPNGDGLTDREVGKRLHVSAKTVENRHSRPLAEPGARGRAQAAVLATPL